MRKLVLLTVISVFLVGGCASVNKDGRVVFKKDETAARAINATGGAAVGALIGGAFGNHRSGALAGAAAGALIDPNECSEGQSISETTTTKGGKVKSGWKGKAQRHKECGTDKNNRRGWNRIWNQGFGWGWPSYMRGF